MGGPSSGATVSALMRGNGPRADPLEEGLARTYRWIEEQVRARGVTSQAPSWATAASAAD